MLTAAPSLRPCQRDQVQRVVGITAPPLSHATPRGYQGVRSNHQYCPAWRGYPIWRRCNGRSFGIIDQPRITNKAIQTPASIAPEMQLKHIFHLDPLANVCRINGEGGRAKLGRSGHHGRIA